MAGATTCTQCVAGQYSPNSQTACANCPAGSVTDTLTTDGQLHVPCDAGNITKFTINVHCDNGLRQIL